MNIVRATVLAAVLSLSIAAGAVAQPAVLSPVAPPQCPEAAASCQQYDALVFVHGIYGDDTTFRNSDTGFDWPKSFPRTVQQRPIDVFRLNYQSALLSWAKQKNPAFKEVATAMYAELGKLRKRKYRSIGFVAHSLGGNLVSTYLHLVKTGQGHPERAQHAYAITLATPVLGSDLAYIASPLKRSLHIDDDLLKSLEKNNLYLEMLLSFREAEGPKGERYGCRPVHLHAAYETARVGPVTVVTPDSAALAVSDLLASPAIAFNLDHFQIVKPKSNSDPSFVWVLKRVKAELGRLREWDVLTESTPEKFKLCRKVEFIGEP